MTDRINMLPDDTTEVSDRRDDVLTVTAHTALRLDVEMKRGKLVLTVSRLDDQGTPVVQPAPTRRRPPATAWAGQPN